MNIEFKINENTATNLINGYARSVARKDKIEEENDYDEELLKETDYDWLDGYIYAAETFLNALGISPQSCKVQEAIRKAKE